jgi:hypothetical protein
LACAAGPFLPFFGPKVWNYIQRQRAATRSQNLPIVPIPAPTLRALNILFVTCVFFLATTLPIWSPPNIFTLTQSRLQAPLDVIFHRLTSLDPTLAANEVLRSRFQSQEGRLLYLTYGPSVLTDCNFCSVSKPTTFLYYALPSIIAPHLLNLVILGFTTSSLLSGPHGNRWRTLATIAGLVVGAAEVYLVSTYSILANSRALTVGDLDNFFWRMRLYRGVTIALVDALLGWVLYLSSTNRLFTVPPSPIEQAALTAASLQNSIQKLRAVGILQSAVMRDDGLRGMNNNYWRQEQAIMAKVYEQPEVVAAINSALEERIDIEKIEREAGEYADQVVGAGPRRL